MLLVEIHAPESQAAPGTELPLTVTVTNNGPRSVEPVLDVAGLDGGTVDGGSSIGSLAPGASATTTLRVALPADAAAGTRQMAVVAGDRMGSAARGTATFSVHTASAAALSMHVNPRQQRGRFGGPIRVELHNHGDETLKVDLHGDGSGLKVRLRYRTVTLAPGAHVRVRGRVRARRPAGFRERHSGYVVTAQGASTPTRATASLTQRTMLPRTFRSAIALLLLVALWAGAAVVAVRKVGSTGSAAPTTTIAAPDTTTADGQPVAGDAAAAGGAASGDVAAAPGAAPAPVVDAATGKTLAGEGAAALVTASASVGGTVDGPADKRGVAIRLERVAIGDAPGAGPVGKIPAQASLQTATGDALSRQDTITDDGGHFRFVDGLSVPGLYRVTATHAGFDAASVLTQLSVERPTAELAITLAPAKGRLAGKVVDGTGNPIGDAVVSVADDTITYTTRTASAGDVGSWSIDGVKTPSSYVVTASADGFGASTLVIALGGGEGRSDVALTLTAGTATVAGIVTSRGEAIGGITVTVASLTGELTRTTTTLTDTSVRGRFTVPSLPFGRYSVTLSGDGWLTDTREIVLDATAATVTIDDLRRSTATVQGRVFQDAVGSCEYPVPGVAATITAQPCGNVGVTVRNDGGVWRTTSATGTGEFRVSGIPAGTYTVTFERFSYQAVTVQATVGAGDVLTLGAANGSGYDPIHLPLLAGSDLARSSANIVLRDDTALTKPLNVSCLSPQLTMTESAGTARPITVALGSGCPTDAAATDPVTCVTSGTATGLRACLSGEGGVRIEGLTPGAKTLTFTLDGFDAGQIVASVPTNGVAELGDLRLLPLASVVGQITGVNDTPVGGARLFIRPTDPSVVLPEVHGATTEGNWYPCLYDVDATHLAVAGRCVDASANGDYSFGRSLPTGAYEMIAPIDAVVSPTGLGTVSALSLDHQRRARTLQAQAGQITSFDMSVRRYGAVAGVIQTPDATGAGYELVDGVTVTVTGDKLAAGAPGANVTVGSATGRLEAGRYRVDRLVPTDPQGSYSLLFHKDGYSDVTVVVKDGVPFNTELLRNVILLTPPVFVDGHVGWFSDPTDATTTPIENAHVTVSGIKSYVVLDAPPYHESVPDSFDATTNASGDFTSPASPSFVAGEPSVLVSAAGFVTRTVNVSLLGPTNHRVTSDVVLEPALRTLNGVVSVVPTITADEPATLTAASILQNLAVTVRRTDGALVGTASVQNSGAFAMPNVRPGTYNVSISGPGVSTTTTTTTVAVSANDDRTELGGVTVTRRGAVFAMVRTSTGSGVPGVVVELIDGTNTVVRAAITCVDPSQPGGVPGCAAGSVHVDDLDLAGYTVRVSKIGWKGASTTVDLATTPVSTVNLTMLQFGTVSGKLLGGITDTDPNAASLVNVAVTATLVTPADPADTTATGREVTTRTTADGTFVITGAMVAGTWSVAAGQPGYVSQTLNTTVAVADATETRIGTFTLVALPATITGKVTDESGAALTAATIRLVETDTTYAVGPTTGVYTIADVPARTYTLEVSAPERRTITKIVSLRPGDTQTVDVQMSAKVGQLLGRIDGKDDPSSATTVAVTATITLKQGTATIDTFTTSANGNFSRDVPAGSYDAVVSATGYETQTIAVIVEANKQAFLTATLLASVSPVRATIASSKSGIAASVFAGLVVRATKGAATVDQTVDSAGSATFAALTPGTWSLRTVGAPALADPHADSTSQTVSIVRSAATAPSVTFTLDRYEGVTASITSTDGAGSTADVLSGAVVRATSGGASVTLTETSTAGIYTGRAPLAAGTFAVSATKAGFGPGSGSATVSADTVATATVSSLVTMHPLVVTVSSANGGDLYGVTVTATPTAAGALLSGTTDATGTVTLSLPAGSYTLTTTNAANAAYTTSTTVLAPHANSAAALTVAAGAVSTTFTITLSSASSNTTGVVSSAFLGDNKMVLAGATVTAVGRVNGRNRTVSATSAADGSFSLDLTANTSWTLTTTANGHTSDTRTISSSTANTGLDITLARSATSIAGTVSLQGGSGVNGVDIELRSNTNDSIVASTRSSGNGAAAGSYRFANLDPYVTWRVTFSAGATTSAPRPPFTRTVTAAAAGTTISLSVTLAALTGTLALTVGAIFQGQASSTAPLPGSMTLTVTSLATTPSIEPLDVTQSAALFTVIHLPVGSYRLSLAATGYGHSDGSAGPVDVASVTIATNATNTQSLTIAPLPRDVDITVNDTDGTAASAVTSVVLKGGGVGASGQSGTRVANTGVWHLDGVPVTGVGGASYSVNVNGSGLWVGGAETGFVVTADTAEPTTTLTHRVTLSTVTLTLKGRDDTATTFADAAALTGAGVNPTASATAPGAPTATSLTGTGGVFVVKGALPTGSWSFTLDATGYQATTSAATVTGGTAVATDVVLTRDPATVTVRGLSSGLANVTVTATKGTTTVTDTTDPLGGANLVLGPGDWTLTTSGASSLAAPYADLTTADATTFTVAAAPGAPGTKTVTLTRLERLTVDVTGLTSHAAGATATVPTGVTVTATDPSGTNHTLTASATTNRFTLTGDLTSSAAGESWTVVASATGYGDATTMVTMRAATDTSTTTTMYASARSVSFTVSFADGRTDFTGVQVVATQGALVVQAPAASAVSLLLEPGTWSVTTSGVAPDYTNPAAITVTVPNGSGAIAPASRALAIGGTLATTTVAATTTTTIAATTTTVAATTTVVATTTTIDPTTTTVAPTTTVAATTTTAP